MAEVLPHLRCPLSCHSCSSSPLILFQYASTVCMFSCFLLPCTAHRCTVRSAVLFQVLVETSQGPSLPCRTQKHCCHFPFMFLQHVNSDVILSVLLPGSPPSHRVQGHLPFPIFSRTSTYASFCCTFALHGLQSSFSHAIRTCIVVFTFGLELQNNKSNSCHFDLLPHAWSFFPSCSSPPLCVLILRHFELQFLLFSFLTLCFFFFLIPLA